MSKAPSTKIQQVQRSIEWALLHRLYQHQNLFAMRVIVKEPAKSGNQSMGPKMWIQDHVLAVPLNQPLGVSAQTLAAELVLTLASHGLRVPELLEFRVQKAKSDLVFPDGVAFDVSDMDPALGIGSKAQEVIESTGTSTRTLVQGGAGWVVILIENPFSIWGQSDAPAWINAPFSLVELAVRKSVFKAWGTFALGTSPICSSYGALQKGRGQAFDELQVLSTPTSSKRV